MKARPTRNETDRARRILEVLRRQHPDLSPPLNHRNGFELMVGVILSAQTTDAQVNAVTPELFRRFPTPAALGAAPLEEIEAIVRPTGFYRSKAKNIRAAAAALAERFGGEVPRTIEELVSLPGIGRKGANAVAGALYDVPAVIVDTHFSRVCRRLGFTTATSPERIEQDMAEIVPEAEQTAFSMAINFHGRSCCTARKPQCHSCPIRVWCPYPEQSSPVSEHGEPETS
jgi:endonuclease-3